MTDAESGPREADSDLNAVDAGRREAVRIAAAAATADRAYFAQLGALIGALGLVVGLTSHAHPWVMIAGIFAYGALMQVVVYLHQRSTHATARGWTSRFAWALGTASLLYALGVVGATTGAVPPRLAIWLPYAVLTAAPLLAAALVRGRTR